MVSPASGSDPLQQKTQVYEVFNSISYFDLIYFLHRHIEMNPLEEILKKPIKRITSVSPQISDRNTARMIGFVVLSSDAQMTHQWIRFQFEKSETLSPGRVVSMEKGKYQPLSRNTLKTPGLNLDPGPEANRAH